MWAEHADPCKTKTLHCWFFRSLPCFFFQFFLEHQKQLCQQASRCEEKNLLDMSFRGATWLPIRKGIYKAIDATGVWPRRWGVIYCLRLVKMKVRWFSWEKLQTADLSPGLQQKSPISEALNLQAAHGNWFVKGKAKEGKSGFQGGKGAKNLSVLRASTFLMSFFQQKLWCHFSRSTEMSYVEAEASKAWTRFLLSELHYFLLVSSRWDYG